MERGILLVEADHPGWVQILQTKQRALLASARRRFPELNIRSIAFRLSRDSIAPPTGSPPLEKTPLEKKTSENTAAIAGVSALPPKPAVSEITPEDDEFYAAMKELELVLKKRNGLT
jgi:hypothetical protein